MVRVEEAQLVVQDLPKATKSRPLKSRAAVIVVKTLDGCVSKRAVCSSSNSQIQVEGSKILCEMRCMDRS